MHLAASLILAAALSWLGIAHSWSATIQRIDNGSSPAFFVIDGTIEDGDDARFIDQVLGMEIAVIILNSDGGSIDAAIKIGQAIRLKGFGTFVADGAICASACGLVWLAGQPRFMTEHPQIGFHAAYDMTDGTPREKGAPNAVIGAYLGALGLSQRVILYVTTAPPDGMQWLSLEDASSLGIEIRRLDSSIGGPSEEPAPAPGLAPVTPEMLVSGEVPQFLEYPAEAAEVGRRAPADLSSPEAWMFRTRLRNAAKQEPNFAGQHVLASWGCGSTCVTGAAVNLATGQVTFLPGSVCCWAALMKISTRSNLDATVGS